MLKVHYIRGNASEAAPGSHVAVDTEGTSTPEGGSSRHQVHYLWAVASHAWRTEGGRVTREQQHTGTDIDEWWQWLYRRCDRRRVTWVWGHNIGYDLTLLRVWERIESGELVFSCAEDSKGQDTLQGKPPKVWTGTLITGDPPTIISCRTRTGKRITFVDLLNWANAPLQEIASALGEQYPPRLGDSASEGDAMDLCLARSRIVRGAVSQIVDLVKSQHLGQFRSTIASQAYHAWRHPEPECELLPTADPEVRALERGAYYGGRCHVYYCGQVYRPEVAGVGPLAGASPLLPVMYRGPVYQMDVVGCYPSVMAGNRYPVRHYQTLREPTPDKLRDMLRAYCVIAAVSLNSPEHAYPRRKEGEVGWFCGKFSTVLAGPELSEALRRGHVTHCDLASVYVADRPFDSFVDRLWRMRQMYTMAGKPLQARIIKAMMAGLHGKLAQRSGRWELVPGKVAPQPWGTYITYDGAAGATQICRAVGGLVQTQGPKEEASQAMPALSAYVTSYARLLVASYRLMANPHNVLYEDADSIHVTQDGYEQLVRNGVVSPGTMGMLKVEHQGDVAVYHGRKDYRLGGKIVKAGRQREAVQTPKGDYQQTDFLRLDSILAGRPGPGPVGLDRSLHMEHPLIGASVGPDGWTRLLRLC